MSGGPRNTTPSRGIRGACLPVFARYEPPGTSRENAGICMILGMILALVAAQNSTRPLTPAERTAIESSIKEVLNDPGSATFRHNSYQIGSDIYCGRVNAKNRFGGYVGDRIFKVNVKGGKKGALPASGKVTILRTGNQFDGDEIEQLLFMVTEAGCSSVGYETGYTPVKVGK